MRTSTWNRIVGIVAVLALTAIGIAPPVRSEIGGPVRSCTAGTAVFSTGECPGFGSCHVSINALLVIRKPNCKGCCLYGTATLTCGPTSLSAPISGCANCEGQAPPIEVNCPTSPPVPFGVIIIACTNCVDE